MTSIEEFLTEVNVHELYGLAELHNIPFKTSEHQKSKAEIIRQIIFNLEAEMAVDSNDTILREFLKNGRIQAFAFEAKPVPNLLNEIFVNELDKYYDIVESDAYIMYQPRKLYFNPKSIWYCELKNASDEIHFIAFQKFLKKNTLSIHTINNELMSKFGIKIDKPLLTTDISEIFRKVKNSSLEYVKANNFKIFYSSHVAKDKFITSSTHLSSGNEKVTKNLTIRESQQKDDLDINLFIKKGMVIDDKPLLDYMVVNATDAIINKLQEIKINLIKIQNINKYDRYKLLITKNPNIIHSLNFLVEN